MAQNEIDAEEDKREKTDDKIETIILFFSIGGVLAGLRYTASDSPRDSIITINGLMLIFTILTTIPLLAIAEGEYKFSMFRFMSYYNIGFTAIIFLNSIIKVIYP